MVIHSLVTNRDAIARVLGESWRSPEAGVSAVVAPIDENNSVNAIAAVLDLDLLTERGGHRPLDQGLLEELKTNNIIAWSGSLGSHLFASDIRSWGQAGQQAFVAMTDRLRGPLIEHGKRLLMRPHCRHVLSDAQRTLSFMLDEEKRTESSPFGLALDPVALLEATMLGTAADHIERSLQALGARADIVILTGAVRPDSADLGDQSTDEPPVLVTPIHNSLIDPVQLGEFVSRYVPESTPLVLLEKDLNEQLRLLERVRPYPSRP